LEKEIAQIENEIMTMDALIFENAEEVNSNPEFFTGYQEKKNLLEDMMMMWGELHEQLEIKE
jgi:hypothetical protein